MKCNKPFQIFINSLLIISTIFILADCESKKIRHTEKNFEEKYVFIGDTVENIYRVAIIDSLTGEYRCGFLDVEGNKICSLKYSSVENFREGLAAVAISEKVVYSNNGEKYERNEYRWGFINTEGEEIVKPRYKQVGNFNEGLAVVYESGFGDENYKKELGYVDKYGELVIPIRFDRITERYVEYRFNDPYFSSFFNGRALILQNNKYGFINKKGEYIWKPTK